VGVVSAAFVVGETPRATDWIAAAFIAAAIAAATARRGDNARA
jgi:drug/metabolite transporter (DMT)-like permease